MLNEELEVDVPSDRPVKLKNKPGMDPKISEANGRRIYHWTNSHLEREDDEKNKDKTKDKKKKKKKSDEERPDVQVTTFVSWEQIGRWYAGLDKDRRPPSPVGSSKRNRNTKWIYPSLYKGQGPHGFRPKNFAYLSFSLCLG